MWWEMFPESNALYIMLVPLFHLIAIDYGLGRCTSRSCSSIVVGMHTPPVGVVVFVV